MTAAPISTCTCISVVTRCLTTGALFAAVCAGALADTLAALRSALAVSTQHLPGPAGCYRCMRTQSDRALLWVRGNRGTQHRVYRRAALTALRFVPSVRAVPNAIAHLPQRDAASVSTAELPRTSWRHKKRTSRFSSESSAYLSLSNASTT